MLPLLLPDAIVVVAQATYEPKTWLGLLGLLIVGAVMIAPAAIPAWITVHRQRGIGSDVAETKAAAAATREQMQNDHEENFRNVRNEFDVLKADVVGIKAEAERKSGLLTDIAHELRGMREDFGLVRDEIRAERKARAEDIDAAVTRLQKRLDRDTRQ